MKSDTKPVTHHVDYIIYQMMRCYMHAGSNLSSNTESGVPVLWSLWLDVMLDPYMYLGQEHWCSVNMLSYGLYLILFIQNTVA